MEYKEELKRYLSWQQQLLNNKNEVAQLVSDTLDKLKTLFDEDRVLYLKFLANYFCSECGVMYDVNKINSEYQYICDCDILKNKKD